MPLCTARGGPTHADKVIKKSHAIAQCLPKNLSRDDGSVGAVWRANTNMTLIKLPAKRYQSSDDAVRLKSADFPRMMRSSWMMRSRSKVGKKCDPKIINHLKGLLPHTKRQARVFLLAKSSGNTVVHQTKSVWVTLR